MIQIPVPVNAEGKEYGTRMMRVMIISHSAVIVGTIIIPLVRTVDGLSTMMMRTTWMRIPTILI